MNEENERDWRVEAELVLSPLERMSMEEVQEAIKQMKVEKVKVKRISK